MGLHRGRVEAFHDDQLVVALADRDILTRTLAGLGVGRGKVDSSTALGLALVRNLANVDAAVRALQQDADIGPELRRFQEERNRTQPTGADVADVADLDLLVRGIRLKLASSFPGWAVTIGKNYVPSYVKGYPHVDGGGDGEPKPTDEKLGPADPRRGGTSGWAAACESDCSTPDCSRTSGWPAAT